MTKTYFNSIDSQSFYTLSKEEKIKELVKKKIYVKGKSNFQLSNHQINSLNLLNTDYRYDFIGKDFEVNFNTYKLNDKILNELEKILLENIEETFEIIEQIISNYKRTFHLFESTKIENDLKQLNDNKIKYLHNELFFDLSENIQEITSENVFQILKKYINNDSNFIFSYLAGSNQNSNFCITLHSFLLQEHKTNFIQNNVIKESNIKNSIPKKVALLHDLGVFEHPSFKYLLEKEKYLLLCYLFDIDIKNSNKVNDVRRNFSSLKENSNENISKYTAITHIGKIITDIIGNKN